MSQKPETLDELLMQIKLMQKQLQALERRVLDLERAAKTPNRSGVR